MLLLRIRRKPKTKAMSAMFEPTTVPKASEVEFSKAEEIETKSSGIEVAPAIKTKDTTKKEILKAPESRVRAETRAEPDQTRKMRGIINLRTTIII